MRPARITIGLLTLALAVGAAGCGEGGSTNDPMLDARLQIDDAFVTIAPLQNANAINFSQAILKTTDDPQIKALANSVIKTRSEEDERLTKLQKNYLESGAPTPAEAAKTLGSTPSKLAISAGGDPLAAPSSDSAYLKALIANAKGQVIAIKRDIDDGGPGTVPFAKEMFFHRTDELDGAKALR